MACPGTTRRRHKTLLPWLNKKLRLEKPRIECEWRDRCNRYPSTTRVTVINQHIAIGRGGDGYDDRRDHENERRAFIDPYISECLRVGFARGPIGWPNDMLCTGTSSGTAYFTMT